jgi:phage protein D
MQDDHFRIEVDGAEIDQLYQDLVSLEVELDEELASMFRLTIAITQVGSTWTYLDDERFAIWKRVVVTAGLEDDAPQLIAGYVTSVRPEFSPDLDQCRLLVWGMDATALMDRQDRLKDWPNKRDSDIATETFQAYGLTPQVTDTDVTHDEEVSTIIQRETDIKLLKRLALRNGFECFVDGDTGHFQPPGLSATAQPVLAIQFGDETNLNRFALEVNALTPAGVAMFQLDRASKDVLDVTAEAGRQRALGANAPDSYLAPGMEPGLVYVGGVVTTGTQEMTALCQGLQDQGEWFVTGEGEVAANQYGTVLKPRAPVTIKGVGETHSGTYYVTHVTHVFAPKGYTQAFRVKRNALAPVGDEVFTAGGGLLGGLV